MTPVCTLEITRGDPAHGVRVERFAVPYDEGMSLLDAVFWIRLHVDPSIAVRFSCRSANACKECSAVVNGKAGYLCVIKAAPDKEFRIEPLPKRPWLRDLVVELESPDRLLPG